MKYFRNFFLIICLGIIIGCFVGGIIDFLPSSGVFTSWEFIDSPVKFTQIMHINSEGIWAQTTDNKLYFWGFADFCRLNVKCLQWVEMANIPNNAYSDDHTRMSKGKNCPESNIYPKKYPGEIVECALVFLRRGSGYYSTYFALTKEGMLWEWAPPSGTDSPIITLFIGPFIGLLLGIIVGTGYLIFQQRQRSVFVLGCGVALTLCIGIFVYNGIVIIRSDQRGIVISAFEPNGYRAKPLEPGIHWISPFFEAVQNISIAPQTYTMSSSSKQGDDSIQARTKDGKQVFINASVIYAVDPAQLIRLHITWQNRYEENVVRPITRAAIRDVVLQYNAAEINGDKRAVIQQLIENKIKQSLMDNSLILLDFTIQAIRLN